MTSNTRPRSLILVGLLLVSAVGGLAVAGTVAAQNATNGTSNDTGMNASNGGTNASIMAQPDAAGATANHTVSLTVPEAAGNLTGVSVNYSGTNASVVQVPANVFSVTLDNQSIAPNATTRQLGGEVVNVTIDLNRSVAAGDRLSMVYGAGNPPEAGNYTIDMQVNPGNDPVNTTATLDISESMATPTTAMGVDDGTTTAMMGNDTTTAAMGDDTTTATMGDDTTTEEDGIGVGNETETTTEEETPTEAAGTTTTGNGPGFTAIAALVGVLAAALLATRRN